MARLLQVAWRASANSTAVRGCSFSLMCHAVAIVGLALVLVPQPGNGRGIRMMDGLVAETRQALDIELLSQPPDDADFAMVSLAEAVRAPAGFSGPAPQAIAVLAEPPAGDDGRPFGFLDGELERAASSALGNPASANFYGIEANGDRFVFVVDMSRSMLGSRYRRARGELRRSIDELDPSQQFFVILFNNGAYPMPAPGLLAASDQNVRDTVGWLKQIQCQGSTYPVPALRQALELEPDAIFLLTDGKFEPLAAHDVQLLGSGDTIPIHTIGFMNRAGEPMLRAIAEATGGTYRFVR